MKRYALTVVTAGIVVACGENLPSPSLTNPVTPTVSAPATAKPTLAGDDAYWEVTYSPARFRVLSNCEVETGIVMYVGHEHDGDLTFHIKVDSNRLLGPGNKYLDNDPLPPCGPDGCLQVEVPCQGPIDQADAIGTCQSFRGRVLSADEIPNLGDRIIATAPWLEDKQHHDWRELHGAVIKVLTRSASWGDSSWAWRPAW